MTDQIMQPPAPPNTPEQATAICYRQLERTRQGIVNGDFEIFATCFHIPCLSSTMNGQITLRTMRALRMQYNNVREYYQSKQITDLVRRVISAEFRTPQKIHMTYESWILSGAMLVDRYSPAFSVLDLIENRWRCTHTSYAVDRSEKLDAALSGKAFEHSL